MDEQLTKLIGTPEKKGFQKALVLAPGLSVQTMRLWAWLVQGYSILAENGMVIP